MKKYKIGKWSEDEIKFFKENYLTMSNGEIADSLNRTYGSVSAKSADLLAIKEVPGNRPHKMVSGFTEKEEQFIIDNHGRMSTRDMGEKLDRSLASISARIHVLRKRGVNLPISHHRVTTWTPEEEQFLIENAQKLSVSAIAEALGKTWSLVHGHMQTKNIPGVRGKQYSEEEVQFVKDNYKTMSRKEMVEHLGKSDSRKSPSSVIYNILVRLGIIEKKVNLKNE